MTETKGTHGHPRKGTRHNRTADELPTHEISNQLHAQVVVYLEVGTVQNEPRRGRKKTNC